jgi:DNA-binding HxlR family transcriptional regulator
MLGRTYEDQVCSVARALEVLGERWTLLLVRDALLGIRRFDDFQQSLGIARNVLAERLRRLVEAGVLERVRYEERPPRFEYRLTAMGRALGGPVVSLMQWGDRYLPGPGGPPRVARHRGCGGTVHSRLTCAKCHEHVVSGGLEMLPGPALRA